MCRHNSKAATSKSGRSVRSGIILDNLLRFGGADKQVDLQVVTEIVHRDHVIVVVVFEEIHADILHDTLESSP